MERPQVEKVGGNGKKGKVENMMGGKAMISFTREWAMPNGATFTILPIKNLIEQTIAEMGKGIVICEPFAGDSKYGTITNDLNPDKKTTHHMDALEFLKTIPSESVDLVLYDPPYSITQAAQLYKSYGKEKLAVNVANMKYWSLCKDNVARILKVGGMVLSFGWNTNGCGKNRGCELTDVMVVAHGGSKNDTLVTKEVKNYIAGGIYD